MENPKSVLRHIFEDIESGKARKLKIDDELRFECKRCGECCHDIDVLVTSYDIMRLCNNLGLLSREFLDKYGYMYKGPESGLPIAIIKFKDDGVCQFLDADECKVYKDRPGACRSYPVGRMIDEQSAVTYFQIPSPSYCRAPITEKRQTLQEWIMENEIEEYHKMNSRFINIIFKLGKNEFVKQYDTVLGLIGSILYNFDISIPRYAKSHNLPVPVTYNDKISMIERTIDDVIDTVTKIKSALHQRDVR